MLPLSLLFSSHFFLVWPLCTFLCLSRLVPVSLSVSASGSCGRSAVAVGDRLSLVLPLGDPVLVLLPKRRMVAHERHERPGLHSCHQLWRGGTTQELSSDVVARIRSRLRLAGLLLLGRAQGETISGSAGG